MDMARDDYAREHSKEGAELPEEFGFHYPHNINEIRNAAVVLEVFKMWPDDGGYFDQDARLMDDIRTYKRVKDHIYDQHKPKGDSE